MNAATRMRASWKARLGVSWACGAGRDGTGPAGVCLGGGSGVAVVGKVSEGAVPDMIPIRYVTDRFVFQEERTRW